jgi:hypothetical protein
MLHTLALVGFRRLVGRQLFIKITLWILKHMVSFDKLATSQFLARSSNGQINGDRAVVGTENVIANYAIANLFHPAL